MPDQIRGRAVSDGLKSIGNDDAADFGGVFYRVCRLCRSSNERPSETVFQTAFHYFKPLQRPFQRGIAFDDGFELVLNPPDGFVGIRLETQHQNRRGIGGAHQAETVGEFYA